MIRISNALEGLIDAGFGPWLKAALTGMLESVPMFGLGHGQIVSCSREVPELRGSYVSLESEEFTYLIGIAAEDEVIITLAASFLGLDPMELFQDPSIVKDAIGEMANILVGRVKVHMSSSEGNLVTGLPIIASGAIEVPGEVESAAIEMLVDECQLFLVIKKQQLQQEMIERRAIQRKLKDREARFRTFWNGVAEGLCTVDESSVIESLNPAARNIFGLEAPEGPGMPIRDLIPAWEETVASRGVSKPSQGEIQYHLVEGVHRDGSRLPLELSVSRIWLHEGSKFATIIRDITARKKAEQELASAKERVADLTVQTGVTESAIDVLHGISVALNRVKPSTDVIRGILKDSKLQKLTEITKLVGTNFEEFQSFLESDDRGKTLPLYLNLIQNQLEQESANLLEEVDAIENLVREVHAFIQGESS